MNQATFQQLLQSNSLESFLPFTPLAIVIFLIQSSCFLGLVLVADTCLKNSLANMRKFLWFWALMIIPLVTIVANLSPATVADRFFTETMEFVLLETSERRSDAAVIVSAESLSASNDDIVASANGKAFSIPSLISEKFRSIGLWNLLILAYGFVALVLLARIPLGLIHLARLRGNAISAKEHLIEEAFLRAASQLGYSGHCELRLTSELESPVSFGVFDPVILFPESSFKHLTESELQSMLLHELSHVKNRDPLRILLVKIVESVFFIQPLVWLASGKLRHLIELVADDSVLEAGVQPDSYARSIVNIIEFGVAPKRQYALTTGISRKASIG